MLRSIFTAEQNSGLKFLPSWATEWASSMQISRIKFFEASSNRHLYQKLQYPLSGIAVTHTEKWKHIQLHTDGVITTDSVVCNHHVHGSRRGGKPQLNVCCSCCCWPDHYQVQWGAPSKVSLRFEAIQSITELPTSLSLSLSWLQCRWSDRDGRLRGGLHESEICEGTGSKVSLRFEAIQSITELPTSLSLSLSWLRCRWSDHDGRLRGGLHESELVRGLDLPVINHDWSYPHLVLIVDSSHIRRLDRPPCGLAPGSGHNVVVRQCCMIGGSRHSVDVGDVPVGAHVEDLGDEMDATINLMGWELEVIQ